jgi:hypothetical protein
MIECDDIKFDNIDPSHPPVIDGHATAPESEAPKNEIKQNKMIVLYLVYLVYVSFGRHFFR